MSVQDTIQTPQIDTPTQNLKLGNDSLNLNDSFRTPLMQINNDLPAHLQQSNIIIPKPKVVYQFLSHEDSIFLNLIKIDEGIFENAIYYPKQINTTQTPIENKGRESQAVHTTTKDTIEEEIIAIDTNQNQISTIGVEAYSVKSRKQSAFSDSKDWLSGFILLILIIAGLVKLSAGKYLNNIFSSVRYQQTASKLFSSVNLQNQKPGWALTGLFVLTSSLLIFEYTIIFGNVPANLSKLTFLLSIIAGILFYFGIKTILYRFVAFVFETSKDTNEYIFNADILSKAFGITILPIVSIIPFVDYLTSTYLLKAGLALFLIMYAIQLLRGAKIILRSPLSIFYMFLYFCALEILPLSILIKLMIL